MENSSARPSSNGRNPEVFTAGENLVATAASPDDSGDTAAAIKARSGGRRRSCNRCSSKKERCDGQEPCQRCKRSGLQCLYATCRTLGRPRNSAPMAAGTPEGDGELSVARRAAEASGGRGSGSGSKAKTFSTVRSRRKADSDTGVDRARPKRPTPLPSVSLKRASLSPSPATGLTGMVENKYLTSYVDHFSSFFQVLDETTVRLGLINLMSGKVDSTLVVAGGGGSADSLTLGPSTKRFARAVNSNGGDDSEDGRGITAKNPFRRGSFSTQMVQQGKSHKPRSSKSPPPPAPPPRDHEVYAINSAIFSAMAVGALLLGQLPLDVEQYITTARASLRLCSDELVPSPDERVAAAHLLLAFATNLAGKDEYGSHIDLTRQCYNARLSNGLSVPPPIGDVLVYRAIIDAITKPQGSKDRRVSAPQGREIGGGINRRSVGVSGVGATQDALAVAASEKVNNTRRPSSAPRGSITTDMVLDSVNRRNSTGGGSARGRTAGASVAAAVAATRAAVEAAAKTGDPNREQRNTRARWEEVERSPAGLEAARERGVARKAEPMMMVCDIMTVLSNVPWSMKGEHGAQRTRDNLSELRTLMVVEKTLSEERRSAKGKNRSMQDTMAVFAVNSALIGLSCALSEFGELLELGRELSTCITACPGLARYNPHSFHNTLAILMAFGKKSEFIFLLSMVTKELRRSSCSGRPIVFDEYRDMCSMPVCVKHAKAILEMAKRRKWDQDNDRIPDEAAAAAPRGERSGRDDRLAAANVAASSCTPPSRKNSLPSPPTSTEPAAVPAVDPHKEMLSAAATATATTAAMTLVSDLRHGQAGGRRSSPQQQPGLAAVSPAESVPLRAMTAGMAAANAVANAAANANAAAAAAASDATIERPDDCGVPSALQPAVMLSSSAPMQNIEGGAFAAAAAAAVNKGRGQRPEGPLRSKQPHTPWGMGPQWGISPSGVMPHTIGSTIGASNMGGLGGVSVGGHGVDSNPYRGNALMPSMNLWPGMALSLMGANALDEREAARSGAWAAAMATAVSGPTAMPPGYLNGSTASAAAAAAAGASIDQPTHGSPFVYDPYRDQRWRGGLPTGAPMPFMTPVQQQQQQHATVPSAEGTGPSPSSTGGVSSPAVVSASTGGTSSSMAGVPVSTAGILTTRLYGKPLAMGGVPAADSSGVAAANSVSSLKSAGGSQEVLPASPRWNLKASSGMANLTPAAVPTPLPSTMQSRAQAAASARNVTAAVGLSGVPVASPQAGVAFAASPVPTMESTKIAVHPLPDLPPNRWQMNANMDGSSTGNSAGSAGGGGVGGGSCGSSSVDNGGAPQPLPAHVSSCASGTNPPPSGSVASAPGREFKEGHGQSWTGTHAGLHGQKDGASNTAAAPAPNARHADEDDDELRDLWDMFAVADQL